MGFDATYRNAASLPDHFRLNGTACQATLSIAVPSTPPTVPQHRAPADQRVEKAAKGPQGHTKKEKDEDEDEGLGEDED